MACELCIACWHGSNRLYGRMVFIVCYGLRIVHCPLARLKLFVWENGFHRVLWPANCALPAGTAQTVCMGEWFSSCVMACELCTARWHGSNRLYGRMVFIVCYGLRIVHCPLARLKPFVWEKVFHCVLRPFVRPFVRPCNRGSDRPYVCPSIPPSV